jgi:CHAD domain-containing protein
MQASQVAGISRGRARYWKRQFISKGMDIFDITITGAKQEEAAAPQDNAGVILPMLPEPPERVADELIEADEALPFPEVQKSIGIKAEDNLAEAGKKVWLYHFAIMLSHEAGTIRGDDSEELHDMRVATRRMRTAFEVFGEAFDPKIMRHYLKGLRKVGKALGRVRDMDVILENGIHYQEKMPEETKIGLEPLLNQWRAEVNDKRDKLTKQLESESYKRFKAEFNHFVQTPVEIKHPGNLRFEHSSLLGDIVPVMLYNRYAKVRAYDGVLPNATFDQLHALRIEFKKFRYTLEYFREILGETASAMINEIKKYQDHLGVLHDADVACRLVNDFLNSWEERLQNTPIQARVSPEAIVSYLAHLHAERYRLMVAFPDLWKRFNRPEFRQGMAQAIANL